MSAVLSAAKMASRQSAVGSDVWDGVSDKRASPSSCIKTVFDGRGGCGTRSDRGGAMFGAEHVGSGVDTVAHIVQAALTPVFLLSGIATLLNVFSTRLARVADQVDAVSHSLALADAEESRLLARRLARLRLRSLALDAAVILAATGGAATCGAVLALFVSSLREMSNSEVLFGLFGLAVICALGGVLAFTVEMLIAGTGIRKEVVLTQRAALPRMRGEGEDTQEASDAGRQPGASD